MINHFFGPHRFLSNFFPCHVHYGGKLYYSVEHAYQSAKCMYAPVREVIRLCSSAGEAKAIGTYATMRPDWSPEVRRRIMYQLLQEKFSQQPQRGMLIRTGIEPLVEGNNWHDNFWGACTCKGCSDNILNPKHNWLGRMLMTVRESLQGVM